MKTFTIEVKRADKRQTFTFQSLVMSHQECLGGEITTDSSSCQGSSWRLSCERCKARIYIDVDQAREIILTAINGESLTIESIEIPGTDYNTMQCNTMQCNVSQETK